MDAAISRSPVAIGGIGGSGTRVIAGIFLELGYYLGGDLNESLDNEWFALLFKRSGLWPVEAHRADIAVLSGLFEKVMLAGGTLTVEEERILADCVSGVTKEYPLNWCRERRESIRRALVPGARVSGAWGWKEPNTHILLPELMRTMPGLRYIHVMRHGLDMSLSTNQNQLRLWGGDVLGREVTPGDPADSLSYWCAVHERFLALREKEGDRLLLLDFDSFCVNPERGLREIAAFLEISLSSEEIRCLGKNVRVPASSGRYRAADLSVYHRTDLAFVRELGYRI